MGRERGCALHVAAGGIPFSFLFPLFVVYSAVYLCRFYCTCTALLSFYFPSLSRSLSRSLRRTHRCVCKLGRV